MTTKSAVLCAAASAVLSVWIAGCAAERDGSARAEPEAGEAARGPYVPGRSYLGRNGYVEYLPGDLPIIISAPHGGTLTPRAIADRRCGNQANDWHVQDLARRVRAALHARTGRYPHVIINRLSRKKLDANRDSTEATCGDPAALVAWREYHAFVDTAAQAVVRQFGRGFFIDLHGHAHRLQRLELGYLADSVDLELTDAELDHGNVFERRSSVRTLSESSPLTFSALLRGPSSLGALYAAAGYPAVPSPPLPAPGRVPFFDGRLSYNLVRHACSDGGPICGVQLEMNYRGVRQTPEQRAKFAAVTAAVLERYMAAHYGSPPFPAAR